MSLATNVTNLATRIATECKALRTMINGNAADLSGLNTTIQTNLVAAINELEAEIDVLSSGGGATSLDGLSDVAITSVATGHILRHNGTQFVNALGSTYFEPAGAAAAMRDSILGAGVPAALDTLDELAAALGDDANFAATVTTSLAGKQPLDATLTALAALSTSANEIAYSTGADAFAMTALTAYARTLLAVADAAAARTALDVYSKAEIGDPTTNFVTTFEAGLI